jgi:ATP-dependent Clp protease ATP-binding subunit ClpA
MGPFDRFDDRAKRVLALAQDEAIRFNHNYIGVEHLILGLLREGQSVAARVLSSLGLTLGRARSAAEFMIGRGQDGTTPSEITLHPRVKKVIELAVDESQKLGHSHVGPAHLLLGVVREGEGIASGLIESFGLTLEQVRHQVIATLSQPDAGPGAASEAGSRGTGGGPFDRFDHRAKRVLALAQDEAIRFDHNYIGTEHLLLGLVREGEGVAWQVLTSLGVELTKVRTAVEFIIGRGNEPTSPSDITLSPRTKKVIELAIDEARKLRSSIVSTEHLLLGLAREGQGIASGILESLGVTMDAVRKGVIAALEQRPPQGTGGVAAADPRGSLTDAQGNKRDWYCEDVLSGKLKVHVIHEDDLVLAFEHPVPEYVAHAVVIPKKHVAGLMADEAADPELLRAMIRAVQAVARSVGLHEQGFRIEANAAAPGVTPHMHWHVIGPGLPPPRRPSAGAQISTYSARMQLGRVVGSGGPFSTLTDRSKRALALAQDEAMRMGHNYMGTEHLLLGLLRCGSAVVDVLKTAGLDHESARAAVTEVVPQGEGPEIHEVTITPRVKKVIEIANELARPKAGQTTPEHLLIALVDEGGGIAARILQTKTKVDEVRAALMRLIEGSQ